MLVILTCGAVLLLAGCKSSEESSQKDDQATQNQTPSLPPKQEVKTADKVDTVDVTMQNSQKPSYEPSTTTPSSPATGGFAVQVGAYRMQDNADRVAQLVKERFGKQVYIYPDRVSGFYKVMVGNFALKDDARKFRDEMAQRFPSDYKDAWVSENTQK